MQNLLQLKQLLFSDNKQIVITTHQKPDADALGSSLALFNLLKVFGHQVTVITPTDYPKFIHWMPGNHCVINFESSEFEKERAISIIQQADLICCLDFSSYERLKDMASYVEKSKSKKLLVDHHLDPSIEAEFNYWNPNAAATCELIFDLIVELGCKDQINLPIAECIYAGIMTDTGSFRFPSTSKKIHQIIAELIEIGVDNSRIHRLVYDNNSLERLQFLGFALSEKLKVLPEYKTAYIAISHNELKRYNSQTGDTEGIVNYALSIEDVVFAVIIIEREDAVKLSFRSSGEFAANTFAANHFFGGGHKNAAGGKSDIAFDKTVEKFLTLLPEYKEQLHLHSQSNYSTLIPC